MGRIRTIKPEFHSHEELSALPAETHLFASALVNYADDYGYFNANPVLVKAGTNPLRIDKTKTEDQLEQLERIGYIEVRRSGIKHYGRILKFDEHQRVSHPSPSKLKDKYETLPKSSRIIPESFVPEGNREQGTGNGREHEVSKATPSHPEASLGAVTAIHPDMSIYEAYPRKEGKGAALESIRKAVARLVKGEAPHPPMAKIEAQRYLMRRVLEYERSPTGRQPDKTKIPHPATWFNQKRYDDDQSNWHHTEKQNGTYQSKSESTFDALKRSIEAGRNQGDAGETGDPQAGEDCGVGVHGLLGGPDAIRPEGHSIGDGVTILSPPR
jgi:hypothetical protein